MQQDFAETIALKALAWLAGNDEVLPVFLGATGASADDLKTQVQDPDFLISVLDFLSMDDDWVRAFCTSENLPFDAPMRARQTLPGGALPNWT